VFHLQSFPLRVIRYELIDGMSIANETFPQSIGVITAAAGAAVDVAVAVHAVRHAVIAGF
jgi:hypothetical protein